MRTPIVLLVLVICVSILAHQIPYFHFLILHACEALGYIVEFDILDTQDHGINHHRQRLVLVAVHKSVADTELLKSGFTLLPAKLPFDSVKASILLKKARGSSRALSSRTNTEQLNIKKAENAMKAEGVDCASTEVFVDSLADKQTT